MKLNTAFLASFLGTYVLGVDGIRPPPPPPGPNRAPGQHLATSSRWVDIWASMPQLTETSNLPPAPFTTTSNVFFNSTIRQTVHITQGSSRIRIRISNAFGVNDLTITAATVALPVNGSAGVAGVQLNTLKKVTFSGSPSFTIPSSGLIVSDPIDLEVKSQSNLAITIYLAQGQQGNSITSHPGSRTTSWWSYGNHVSDGVLTGDSLASAAHWYFISSVEGYVSKDVSSFSIVGDSITDGRGSVPDNNNRWPDLLLANMQKKSSTSKIAILNEAAGGNRILNDGLGPNALSRIDRDVLAHANVKYAMIFEGVNDIGTGATTEAAQQGIADRLILAFQQIVTRIHTFGIPVFAATITPFCAPNSTLQAYSDPQREAARLRVNKWIRESGVFDAVVDFDLILRDPKNASVLAPEYNGGDYLHPNVAGYQKLADEFPLSIFEKTYNVS